MKIFRSILVILSATPEILVAQPSSYAAAAAHTAMNIWPDSFSVKSGQPAKWAYDQGVVLKGIEGVWEATGDGQYFNYLQKSMDFFVRDNGSIHGYKSEDYTLDNINNGKLLLLLYRVTGKEKYKKAADLLRAQLREQPRTSEGGFWHKKVYPNQMWLDGLYMAAPFYAEYAQQFHEDSAFNDIARQFTLIDQHARDPKTGLFYHGWDESKQQQWADKKTGLSPNVWGRALGWYGMAMVDVLDYFPAGHPGRAAIIKILNGFAKSVAQVQDAKTGLWYDIPNKPAEAKNYLESSASAMLIYTLAKGVRKGYLPASCLANAQKAYKNLLNKFVTSDNGMLNFSGTVSVSGLGGKPYRDGSFAYYMSEPVVTNDPKGLGAFINAANEMEMQPTITMGRGRTVLLDCFFNNEWKKDATGANVRYHYVWDDEANSGFSMLGHIFNRFGVDTRQLESAPTAQSLEQADIYLIVDPDTDKETEKPNYMNAAHADVIANWVKNGGVLILMANDAANAELKNFNILAARFGIRFNEDDFNTVEGNKFEQGAITIPEGNAVFTTARKVYIKELSTLDVQNPARTVLTKNGKNIVAIAKYGKGTVFAVGDPWLYNEYTDGRKLPPDYDNYKAAEDLIRWGIGQTKKK